MDEYDKRSYRRASHFGCEVKISEDQNSWVLADVSDISSGGLKLMSATEYEKGVALWFDLMINSFMSEFEVMVKGTVCHKAPYHGKFQYGIRFEGLSPELKIRIDENVHNDRPIEGAVYHNDR